MPLWLERSQKWGLTGVWVAVSLVMGWQIWAGEASLVQSGALETAGSCAHLLKFEPALWTFVEAEGVEPTNNEAEREIRSGVTWRCHSLGTQSESGSLFVERMLTVHATLRRQHRNILEYLIAANQARLLGLPAPSLLPNAT